MPLKVDICGYDSGDGVGGPYVWIQRMCPLLRDRGIDARVRLFHWGPAEEGVVYQGLRKQDIPVLTTTFQDTDTNVRWLLNSTGQDRPDVFITDNVIPGLLAGRYLRASGIPTVGIIRSDDPFYHGIIDRFVAGKREDQLSAVVCVSRFLTNHVIAKPGRLVIVKHIPSGTPVPTRVASKPSGTMQVVYVGRLAQEQKRIVETTQALIRITSELEHVEATLIGDGPDRGKVEQLLISSGSSVSMAGGLDSPELECRLTGSHVILLLSDYEGTPMAVMEAMACGVVPVCLKIRSGIPELIEDGVTGILVENRGDQVVDAIRRLQDSPEFWQRLSTNARTRASEEFSIHTCAEKWEDLLRELAADVVPKGQPTMPRRLRFAHSHSGFAHQDQRAPGTIARTVNGLHTLYRNARVLTGRLRRSLFR